jgi:hypothetical protein
MGRAELERYAKGTLMPYHAATFRLLGSEPRTAPAAEMAVQEAENRLGFVLPPSVREWYACPDAIQILLEHSNQDPPIAPRDFAVVQWQSHRLLPFRRETQGVCTWAIVLDGSDDPPVYVDVDSGGKEWQPAAPTFSAYVHSCVWDYRLIFGQPAVVCAQNWVLSRSALDGLKAAFSEEIQTYGWPGDTQYRFIKDMAAILIWASEDQSDWYIASPDATALEVALMSVWNMDDMGKSLYGWTQIGKAVLEKSRGKTSGIGRSESREIE